MSLKIFFAYVLLTSKEFENHICLFPSFVETTSLCIDMKMIRSSICSGWILFSSIVLWMSRSKCSVACPGENSPLKLDWFYHNSDQFTLLTIR